MSRSDDDIVFYVNQGKTEALRINSEGFWVRGVKVEQGPGEADAVYDAFKTWMSAFVMVPYPDVEVVQ